MKTVQCPNCGAAAQNFMNCDYCGSLFVRAERKGYDPSELFQNGKIHDSFPGLKEELDKNIAYQQKYDCDWIGTRVFYSKESYLDLTEMEPIMSVVNSDLRIERRDLSKSGGISVTMWKNDMNPVQIKSFKEMEEFKLFEPWDGENGYILDFGRDTEGAAFLVTKILNEVYRINKNDSPFFSTKVDLLVDGSIEDYNKFLEAQSAEFRDRENRQEAKVNEGWSENDSQLNQPKKDYCFIATAAMGDLNHPLVLELRIFRDGWIKKRSWGAEFVDWYYKKGPGWASLIKKNKLMKKACFLFVVKPLVVFSRILSKLYKTS